MSQGIKNSQLADLTSTTLENLPDMEFEVAFKYQNYEVVNRWFQSEKVQEESGTQIKRNIVLDTTGNAKHVRLYQKTPINVADTQKQITAPWVQVQTHYSIERREMLRNRKPAAFVSLIKSRRIDATVDLANLLEFQAWQTPSTSSDDLLPRGVPYWISKLLPSTGGSYDAIIDIDQNFSGRRIIWGDASVQINDKGGLNPTLAGNARWRNYVATYTGINADFVKRLRRAFHITNFKSPTLAKDLRDGPAARFRIYLGLDNLVEYEDLCTKANDNIGSDLDPYHGNTTFRRVPLVYIPVLDADPDGAIYGLNHAHFYPIIQSGDWMRESEPMFDVEQHNVQTVFLDGSYQFFCDNVRLGGFCMHKALAT
jgi:hypothetical protein